MLRVPHRANQRFQPVTVLCAYCKKPFKSKGLKKHENSCSNRVHSAADQERYAKEFAEEVRRGECSPFPSFSSLLLTLRLSSADLNLTDQMYGIM